MLPGHYSEEVTWSPRSPGERLLLCLKTRGGQTSADLGKALGISGEAARQQLSRLADQGLVTATRTPRRVGRPTRIWQLTKAGHDRFPDTHAELTVQLLRGVRSTLGQAALDRVLAAREAETIAAYGREMAAASDLAGRVELLARLRAREGYMAEWRKEADGSFLLIENHCPICAAAAACQGLCRSELAVFRSVLGSGVTIERVEHIPAGGRRCAYRISLASK